MRSKQIFETIIIQYDEAVFKETYLVDEPTRKVATITISKIADPAYFIKIDLFNGFIDWQDHYPPAQNVIQAKGLTTMTVT